MVFGSGKRVGEFDSDERHEYASDDENDLMGRKVPGSVGQHGGREAERQSQD
jgi:hypothetical protein